MNNLSLFDDNIMGIKYKNIDDLVKKAKEIEGLKISDVGKSVGLLDTENRKYTKGKIAAIVESNFFGIPINSYERPDFENLDVELKVSPLKYVKSKDLYNMKERVVLKVMDYNDVYNNENWENSKLYKKLKKILFVFYIHNNDIPATEWKFVKSLYWTPDNEEIEMIKNDYEIIRNKIINGEINSERHNTFLGTCPKHQGGYNKLDSTKSKPSSLREHPVLGLAEKRGYCIKQREVDRLIGKHTDLELIEKGVSIGFRNIT